MATVATDKSNIALLDDINKSLGDTEGLVDNVISELNKLKTSALSLQSTAITNQSAINELNEKLKAYYENLGFDQDLNEAGIKAAIEKLLTEKKQLEDENKAITTKLTAINTKIEGIKKKLNPNPTPSTTPPSNASGNSNKKYLKYKSKYLNLKKRLIN